jgi:hypothetical protein
VGATCSWGTVWNRFHHAEIGVGTMVRGGQPPRADLRVQRVLFCFVFRDSYCFYVGESTPTVDVVSLLGSLILN